MVWTSSKWGQLWFWSLICPWRSRSIAPQNNRNLNQGVWLLWTIFGDPSLNVWWVIVRTSKLLIHTQRETQATTIPGGQNWPRVKTVGYNHSCMPLPLRRLCQSACNGGHIKPGMWFLKHAMRQILSVYDYIPLKIINWVDFKLRDICDKDDTLPA